jgi:hypothetical protein
LELQQVLVNSHPVITTMQAAVVDVVALVANMELVALVVEQEERITITLLLQLVQLIQVAAVVDHATKFHLTFRYLLPVVQVLLSFVTTELKEN